MLLFLFGLPGVGKNFVGELLQQHAGFYFYDADLDGTTAMKQAIAEGRLFTDAMRDEYYTIVIERIRELQKLHPHIVAAQGLSKNRHREWFHQAFPEMQFCWVQANESLMVERLQRRKSSVIITPSYALLVKTAFEEPNFPHYVIENNQGEQELIPQLEKIYPEFFKIS